MTLDVHVEPFGNGKLVWLTSNHIRIGLTTFGAAIASCQIMNPKTKSWMEVNCGYAHSAEEHEADTDYMGVTVGRYAGRIVNGTFLLDGIRYNIPRNMAGKHSCHSGGNALEKKQWGLAIISNADCVGVRFRYISPHMENGFPAELESSVVYMMDAAHPNVLRMRFHAHVTDMSPAEATLANLFNHAYWNLNGIPRARDQPSGKDASWTQPLNVRNHWVKIPASRVAVGDSLGAPTGAFAEVDGTPLDLRQGRVIGERIDDASLDRTPCGYDHPLAIDGWAGPGGPLRLNCEAISPTTHLCMRVRSTYPALWLYTANNKPLPCSGKVGERYERWSGICIEPQYFPDSGNRPEFPSCVVRRGKRIFDEQIEHEFTFVDEPKL